MEIEIINNRKKLTEINDHLQIQLKFTQETVQKLQNSALTLSSSAEQVSSSSENIAGTQQEISRGSVNQVNFNYRSPEKIPKFH